MYASFPDKMLHSYGVKFVASVESPAHQYLVTIPVAEFAPNLFNLQSVCILGI